jgi:hypothetical protein
MRGYDSCGFFALGSCLMSATHRLPMNAARRIADCSGVGTGTPRATHVLGSFDFGFVEKLVHHLKVPGPV